MTVGKDRRTPPCSVCSRVARRAHAGSSGGPDVRQALERPTMPVHARRGRPIVDGDGACGASCRPPRRCLARHVTVPATRVDQAVHLPALIGPRPCLERLLDRRTLSVRQVPGGLPLPRPRGGVLGSRRGIVGAYRHPLPAPLGRLPLHTRRIETWSSQLRGTTIAPRTRTLAPGQEARTVEAYRNSTRLRISSGVMISHMSRSRAIEFSPIKLSGASV